MWNPLKNSKAVKKSCSPTVYGKKARMKKGMKCRWRPRNSKILITTNQVNSVPITSEAGMRQHKFTWVVVIKISATDLPSQLLYMYLLPNNFLPWPPCIGPHSFLQLECFELVTITQGTCILIWTSSCLLFKTTSFLNLSAFSSLIIVSFLLSSFLNCAISFCFCNSLC